MKNSFYPLLRINGRKSILLFALGIFLGIQMYAQCPSGLLTNANGYYGGFEAGGVNGSNNFGPGIASTDYSYGSHQRQYQIIMNTNGQSGYRPLLPHSGNYFFTTHTSPSRPHWKIWYKSITVVPGQTYEFCAWIANLKENPVAGFQVNINVNVGNATTVVASGIALTNSWVQMCGTYTVPAGVTTIEVEIDDPDPSSVGGSHFLAIDDICFTSNNPPPGIPDFTPFNDINSLSFTAQTMSRDMVVNIEEVLNSPSIGQVVFRVRKLSAFTITYNPTATTADVFGGTTVNNSDWIFTEDANFITCTLKPAVVIPGFGLSPVGFTITRNNNVAVNTSQNITVTIITNSGGDSNSTNNQAVTTITAN